MEKHYFAGTNSSLGFFSYFDNVFNPKEADRIFIIKGGPGVGKSSFMKRIARFFKEKGLFIEYIHCSTDYNSLDGIYVPEHKLMIVDGTPPHTIEAKLPCLVEEILDFGKYLKRDNLLENYDKIIGVSQEKSRFYKSGYRYLGMAGIILEEINDIYSVLTNSGKRCIIERSLISDLDKLIVKTKLSNKPGKIRKMFSDSYTPNGYYSFIDSLSKKKEIWEIVSPNSNYIGDLLEKIVSSLIIRGFNVECFYHPLLATKLQHIYIKELNLLIASKEDEEKDPQDSGRRYILYEESDLDNLENKKSELYKNKELLNTLTKEGMDKFKQAKTQHELLEKIYIRSMDFEKVDLLYERIIADYE